MLEKTRDNVFQNTFKNIEDIIQIVGEGCGTRFEFECYDIGHLYTLAHFLERGLVKPPLMVQTIFGLLGGIGTEPEDVMHMRRTANRLFGNDYHWSILAAGRHQIPLGTVGAIMGGNVRKGSWAVPRHLKIVAIMGGVELDLRQAVLSPGVTEIEVLTVMGGVDIAVPQGVRVETMGIAIMGGFDASAGDVTTLDPDQPVIRLSGIAVMGGVDARIKAPNAKAIRRFNRALLKARARADRSE
jgi:hypothetical protein